MSSRVADSNKFSNRQVDNTYTGQDIFDLSGGINTGLPGTQIKDTQLVNLLNVSFDKTTNLITRKGTTIINQTPASFDHRITSIFAPQFSGGDVQLIITTSNDILKLDATGTFTSIKGSLSLPLDNFYCWKVFNDVVIGCNGHKVNTNVVNPVKWTGTGNIAQLMDGAAKAPASSIAEVWNSRLWLVSAENPNLIYYSKLGDPENFTTGGGQIEVTKNDGDVITGLYAHRGFLFIFKRNSIHRLVPGTPNTDPDQWSISKYANNVGCVSNWTIQAVVDDLIFLSDFGVISLSATEVSGDFATFTLSRDIPELNQGIKKASIINPFASVVNAEDSQYWLAMPTSTSGTENGVVWVLDFQRIKEGLLRWTKYDGAVIGSAYCNYVLDGVRRVYIGGTSNNKNVYRFGDGDVYTDNGTTYTKTIQTKAYNFGNNLTRKQFIRYGFKFNTDGITWTVDYRFDESDIKRVTADYEFTPQTAGNGIWDTSLWGTGTWNGMPFQDYEFYRKIIDVDGVVGNRGLSIQFIFTNEDDEYFIFNGLYIEWKLLTHKHVSDA